VRSPAVRISFACVCCVVVAGCGMFGSSTGLAGVDELVSTIEEVHIDAELAKGLARTASEKLSAIVAPDFSGDPKVAFKEFADAVAASEEKARSLRSKIQEMKAIAGPVFEKWKQDLAQFTSSGMRLRSEARLKASLGRYEAVVAAADPALAAYERLNAALRDHALFLGNDLNSASISEVRSDVQAIALSVEDLDATINTCLAAAAEYVQASALPERAAAPGPTDGQ